jgi:hypothetical protein
MKRLARASLKIVCSAKEVIVFFFEKILFSGRRQSPGQTFHKSEIIGLGRILIYVCPGYRILRWRTKDHLVFMSDHTVKNPVESG